MGKRSDSGGSFSCDSVDTNARVLVSFGKPNHSGDVEIERRDSAPDSGISRVDFFPGLPVGVGRTELKVLMGRTRGCAAVVIRVDYYSPTEG